MTQVFLSDIVQIVSDKPLKFSGTRCFMEPKSSGFSFKPNNTEVPFIGRPSLANLAAKNGDVLFAKSKKIDHTLMVTPAIENNIFSTKFIGLRPDTEILDSRYLYWLLQSDRIKFQKLSYLEGRRLDELPIYWIDEIKIELPDSLREQKRVTYLIDKAQFLLDKITETDGVIENLPESVFYSRFGSPMSNYKRFKEIPLLNVISINKKNKRENTNSDESLLLSNNKIEQEVSKTDEYSIVFDEVELELVKNNNLPDDFVYILSINRKIDPHFLYYQLKTHFEFRSILFHEVNSLEEIRSKLSCINILFPDTNLQSKFSSFCKLYEKLIFKLEQQFLLCDKLFYTVSNKFFRVS